MTPSGRYVRRVIACLFCLVVLTQAAPPGTNSTNEWENESNDDTNPQAANLMPSTTPLERSMQPLFGITKFFLDKMIQPDEQGPDVLFDFVIALINASTPLPDGSTSQSPFTNDMIPRFLKYYSGFLVCLLIGLIFIIVMPIVGMCFCCCRLCGNCGGSASLNDPKSARCKRVTYTMFLALFTIIMLSGVVCAFVTNNLFHAQVTDTQRGFVSHVNRSLNIVEKYINNTSQELKTKPIKITNDVFDKITSQLNQSSELVFDNISLLSGAGPLLDICTILGHDIPKLKTEIETFNDAVTSAKVDATTLNDALKEVQIEIDKGLQSCLSPECLAARSKSNQLKLGIDLDKLPNLQPVSTILEQYIPLLENMADAARDDFTKYGMSFPQNIIDDAIVQLNDVKTSIDSSMNELGHTLTNVSAPVSVAHQYLEIIPRVSIFNIIGYVGVALCCIFLLIVLLLFLGMMFGVCGERPYEDARFCNRGVGGLFLMSSVGFMFLFSAVLMLMTSSLFMLGAPLHTEVCRNLLKPFNSPIVRRVNDYFNLGAFLYAGQSQEKLTILDVLSGCENDHTLYKALQLNRINSIDALVDRSKKDAENYIRKVLETQVFTFPDDFKVIPDTLTLELNKLSAVQNFRQDFSTAFSELKQPLTLINLETYTKELARLGVNSAELNAAITKLGSLAINETLNLNLTIEDLTISLKSIERLNSIPTDAENITKEAGKVTLAFEPVTIKTTIKESEDIMLQSLLDVLTAASNSVSDMIANKIGRCRPLYDSYVIVVGATCHGVLEPYNGFWFVLGTMLILFIPTIIFAVKLTGLYRKTENYVGDSFEATMISSKIYPGDHIPLDDIRIKRAQVPSAGGTANLASSSTSIATAPDLDPGDQRRLIK